MMSSSVDSTCGRQVLEPRRIFAGRSHIVNGTRADHHEQRGSRRSNIARTISRDLNTVCAARAVSGSRRLTSSGVANRSLDATLTFCN